LDSWQEESDAPSTFNCFEERSSFYLFESELNEIDSLELLKLDPSSELLGKNLAELLNYGVFFDFKSCILVSRSKN